MRSQAQEPGSNAYPSGRADPDASLNIQEVTGEQLDGLDTLVSSFLLAAAAFYSQNP